MIKIIDGVYLMSCWALSVLFIYAGIVKLQQPQIFATLIEAYGILPEQILLPVAVILPTLEILAGIGLMLNIKGSLSTIAVLLMLFVVVLSYGIWMGLDVDCGCFSPSDPEAEAFHGLWITLCRDLAMMAGLGCIYGWRRYRTIQSLSVTRLIKKTISLKEQLK